MAEIGPSQFNKYECGLHIPPAEKLIELSRLLDTSVDYLLSGEAPHVHIDRDEQTCKFWLEPVALTRNLGFSAKELRDMERLVIDNQQGLLEAWHAYF